MSLRAPSWDRGEVVPADHVESILQFNANNGAPCTKCDGCPGLDLHFWKGTCRHCGCPHADHSVDTSPRRSIVIPTTIRVRSSRTSSGIGLNAATATTEPQQKDTAARAARRGTLLHPQDAERLHRSKPSSLKKAGSNPRPTGFKRAVSLCDHPPAVQDTYTALEYAREMDCGGQAPSTSDLYDKNERAKAREEEEELVESLEPLRLYGLVLESEDEPEPGATPVQGPWFGFTLAIAPLHGDHAFPHTIFSDCLLVDTVAEGSLADGVLRPGDRVCKVNEAWAKKLKQTQAMLQEAADDGEVDLLIARNEPKPPRPDLTALEDDELERLVFEHSGQTVISLPDARDEFMREVEAALAGRFSACATTP